MAGNVSGAREVVQRHQFADYLNIGTSEKPNWVLMGVGFTTLDETFGAESESEKYVCEPSSSSSVVSYTSVFPFEASKPNYPLVIMLLLMAGIFWPLVILFAVFVPLTFLLMDKMGQLHPKDDDEMDPEEDTYL